MKRGLKIILAGILFLGVAVGAITAYGDFQNSVSVTNRIATGDVNISLEEFSEKSGQEKTYEDPEFILPGDCISKIPRIKNLSEACWVRVKITYKNKQKGLKGLDESNITGMPPEWKRKGDYYYYTKKLYRGNTADVFRKVQIPGNWDMAYEGKKLGIAIRAEAIQAANFTPDFTAMSPWGNKTIQKCIHDTDGLIVTEKKRVKLSVKFDGNAHRLVAAPEDFFKNFTTAMPGDVFEDSVEIKNTTDQDAELFFKTSPECKSLKDQELLKKLELSITMDGHRLYTGNLLAVSLNKGVLLGKFRPDAGGTMRFVVTVPSTLDNAYALRKADVTWIFSVKEEENFVATPSVPAITEKVTVPENTPYEIPDKNRKSDTASYRKKAPVKTGDNTNVWILIALGFISAGTCVIIIRRGDRIL